MDSNLNGMNHIFYQNNSFTWYNLKSTTKSEMDDYLEKFNLTSLTIQDAIEAEHLPKYEHQDNFEFVIFRFYNRNQRQYSFVIREFSNKIGIFIGKDFLISVHQKEVPFWEKIKSKLTETNPKHPWTPHRLYLEILRETLNTYLEPAEIIAKKIQEYENSLIDDDREIKMKLKDLYKIKREADVCRTLMMRTHETLLEYKIYAKHKSAFLDLLELNQKLIHLHTQNFNDLQNLFTLTISISDLRSNEIMKILTVFSAFFLPLTFIVGLYGMNFEYMPELGFKWAYFIVLFIMFAIVSIIFFWFKRKKFL